MSEQSFGWNALVVLCLTGTATAAPPGLLEQLQQHDQAPLNLKGDADPGLSRSLRGDLQESAGPVSDLRKEFESLPSVSFSEKALQTRPPLDVESLRPGKSLLLELQGVNPEEFTKPLKLQVPNLDSLLESKGLLLQFQLDAQPGAKSFSPDGGKKYLLIPLEENSGRQQK